MKFKEEKVTKLRLFPSDDEILAMQTVKDMLDDIMTQANESQVDLDDLFKQYLSKRTFENCIEEHRYMESYISDMIDVLEDWLEYMESEIND